MLVTTHKIGCAAGRVENTYDMLVLSLPVTPVCIPFEVLKKTLINKKDKKQETATKREDVPLK